MAHPQSSDVDTSQLRRYEPGEAPAALKASFGLRAFVDQVGKWASWLFLPMILITVLDVVARKLMWRTEDNQVYGLQVWLVNNISKVFGSTLLQELEWHFHTGLFALVLGFGYIYNTHVRVDLVRENLSFRSKAWIELIGLTIFMIPYCLITTYFAFIFAYDSYQIGEISASTVGLSNRWIIKSVLVAGLIVATLAGIAVWLQMVTVLWGDPSRRFELMAVEWPEEAGNFIEGKRRIELSDTDEAAFAPASKAIDGVEAPQAKAEREKLNAV